MVQDAGTRLARSGAGLSAPLDFLAGGGEMGALMRAHDWQTSPLGPPEYWPDALKMSVSICLNSRFPMVLWWGAEFVMLYNDAWRPVLGTSKHPGGLGRPGIESWPEIWDIIGAQMERVLHQAEASWSEDQLLVLDRYGYNEEAYFTYSYSPVKDATGAVVGIFSAVNETTERVLGERRLQLLRNLAERTADAKTVEEACTRFAAVLGADNPDLPFALLYVLSEDGEVARRMGVSGMDPDDPRIPPVRRMSEKGPWGIPHVVRTGKALVLDDLAERFGDLPGGVWPEPTRTAIVLPVAKAGQEGQTSGVLIAGVNPRRALDDAYRGFLDLVAGHLATAVTNARAYEEERRRAETLAELDRAKTAFFSNVSHEFRTPLTLMLGPMEDVLARPVSEVPPDNRALIEVAHRNGLRLLKLVNNLLDFSRIEAGRVKAAYEPTDLAGFTADLASGFRSATDRAGLRLVVDTPALPQPVYIDREMWEKIILNLVSNAFKFTFEGEIRVSVRQTADGRGAEVEVRDTGVGIATSELPHIFERFHRVKGVRGRSVEGSGIGLALVSELVKLHGGAVFVDSEPGYGTRFRIVLGYGADHLPKDHVIHDGHGVPSAVEARAYVEEALRWLPGAHSQGLLNDAAAESGSVDEENAGCRLLLADDNADMRDYVGRLLRNRGYTVTTVGDGRAALAAAQADPPDLILSDVMMPELDGFGLLAAIRATPELQDIPVLLLSARAGEEARVEGLEAGADDYLTKPFSARELLARVGSNLTLHRHRKRELAEMAKLNAFSSRLIASADLTALLYGVLDAVIELQGADFGNIQLYDPAGGALRIMAQRGFGPAFLDYFQSVCADDGSICGRALRATERVIVEDVETDDTFLSHRALAAASGFRAVQSTPLIANDHDPPIGMLSTHFREPHRPSERELHLTDLYLRVAVDLITRKIAEDRLQEEARALELLNTVGNAVAGELNLEKVVQVITDAATELSGAAFGSFFYNVVDDKGESYMLYTLSSVPKEAFAEFPMPRNTKVFGPTFAGEGIVRSPDITKDPRFGQNPPYHGHPKGHLPVRSYLAAPVISRSGEVLGGLFFGHPETGIFTERAEKIVSGIAAQAAIAIDNARLYQAAQSEIARRAEIERALREGEELLERKVEERTSELAAANRQLLHQMEEREQVEAMLRQMQRLEAIGQLTAGVAHDFNNLLTVVLGSLHFLDRDITDERHRRRLALAREAAERGAKLTGQLLAFSRKQRLEPKPLDLNETLSGMQGLLHSTLGGAVQLEFDIGQPLWPALVDPTQIELVILNLAINARDAMSVGGRISIRTRNARVNHTPRRPEEPEPGDYVVIAVQDTGTGMPPEVIDKAFEPFFTTKSVGKGSGLGLAQVYGFAKQSGGGVVINSKVNEGTTVEVYLPRTRDPTVSASRVPEAGDPRRREGRVLLVDDDPAVRETEADCLRQAGYEVVEAASGGRALEIVQARADLDAIVVDFAMPGMNGVELSHQIDLYHPNLPVLFVTGYGDLDLLKEVGEERIVQKPFRTEDLVRRLEDLIGRHASSSPANLTTAD
jgi:signal transduction histidine kinase/DNA-binding response OmpR family regulator